MLCMVQFVFGVDDTLFFLTDLELVMLNAELAVSLFQLSVGLDSAFA